MLTPCRSNSPNPIPLLPESLTLPANDNLWVHENKGIFPSSPSLGQKAPQDPVCWPHLRPLDAPLVHAQLMPQCQILGLKPRAGLEHCRQETGAQSNEVSHFHSDHAPNDKVSGSGKSNKWRRKLANPAGEVIIVSPCPSTRTNFQQPHLVMPMERDALCGQKPRSGRGGPL